MKRVILKTEKLCKSFSTDGNQQHVLKNIDLEIREGDFTVIMGSSGSGKSTLLYALSGMDRPSLGKVVFQDKDISQCTNDQLAAFRRDNCGFVFQSIYLLDNMSVLDNVLTSALLKRKNRKQIVEETKAFLSRVGITEQNWNKFPTQLSVGECQSLVVVTHDVKTALRANRILYMKDGNICGELQLPLYEQQDMEQRRDKVQGFLNEMGW